MIRALLISAALTFSALAHAQISNGLASKISKAELAKVRKSKYRVLVPTYVPADFVVKEAKLTVDKEAALTDWRVRYQNPKTKAEFTLQMASDGLGDIIFSTPDGENMLPTGSAFGKSPVLGRFEVMFARKGNYKMAGINWLNASKKTFPNFAVVYSQGMDASVVKRIVESLRWLK